MGSEENIEDDARNYPLRGDKVAVLGVHEVDV